MRRFLAFLLALVVVRPALAQTAVDLQLALMVDASGSINQTRFELQKRGYVAALRDPKVLGAILGGRTQSIAITLVQWTGPFLQRQVLPWTLLKDEASTKSAALHPAPLDPLIRAIFFGKSRNPTALSAAQQSPHIVRPIIFKR